MGRDRWPRLQHRSMDFRRRAHCVREEAFGLLWEYENQRRPGISFGHGILQDLMVDQRNGPDRFAPWKHRINNRDAAIVATVIQWLGTNVGWSFLDRALRMCGKKIVDIEPGDDDRSAWIMPDHDLPAFPGRYLVIQRIGSFDYRSQANYAFGRWTDYLNRPIKIAFWYRPEPLPFRRLRRAA